MAGAEMLKMNFLSSSSTCVELVDHNHQARDFDTFSSFSLEKQKEAVVTFLQKGEVFTVEAIQNSYADAPSSVQLNELEKNNVDLTGKFSTELIRHEMKMSEIKESMFVQKTSLAKKDSELKSSIAALHGCNKVYFILECKNVDISQSYDKLLAKFDTYHKAAK
ncbi:hypothetical protein L3X38_042195 [Prunus dulcis]|uniref:Uncharacterized protein n=1 Tax=Prunus dulcis TaxID=3755 RepID=A0AAD4UW52_PRUDU|nr:hypothetical protein L3X38_042195 [Prunus dulcis]